MASSVPPLALVARRRFGPLFATNVLGVFNDNLFKTALLILAAYGLYRAAPAKAALLAPVATGVFILPFFLFSALAGQVADAWERSRLVRAVKLAEVAIMALGLAGFQLQSIGLLTGALFLMGVHSAMYGPLKYAILPSQLAPEEVLGATGVMEAGGFVAILGGQLLAGVVAPRTAGLVACALAALGLGASLLISRAPPVEAGGRIDLNVVRVSWRLVGKARAVRPVWLSILAIAWFYAVGAVLLGELVPLVQGLLHARQEVAVLFLAVFSVGVAAGSLAVNRLLRGEVSGRFVPVSAFLLAGLQLDLALAVAGFHAPGPDLTLGGFLGLPAAWRILLDLAALSVSGGVFVIPLYAVLQTRSPKAERSRILAANNIVNAGVCVVAIAVSTVLLKLGVGITGLIALMGAGTLLVALYACVRLPEAFVKPVLRAVLKALYRVEARGLEHVPVAAPGGVGVVVVANHVSYLDAALLAAFLPGKPTFAVHTRILAAWWMQPVRPFFDAFPVDMTSPLATRTMIAAVRAGRTLVIFPEGRIGVTGGLMKVFAGPAVVADKAGAPLVPVRIEGPERSPFSLMRGKLRRTLLPRVRLTALPPVTLDLGAAPSGRRRRALAADRLYDLMSTAAVAAADLDRTLFHALVAARDVHGAGAFAVEDVERRPLSYGRLVIGARVLGRALEPGTKAGEAVGLMLPNVNAAVAAFFALQAGGRVPAMLNYTAGPAALEAACDAAAVRTVVTSRAFVERAKLEAAVARLEASGRRVVHLEDVAAGIGGGAKLLALLAERLRPAPRRRPGEADETAVILFTSGSEGAPKGVALSHRNLLANCAQVGALIDFNPTDRVFNALPMFHSFGLTGGTLLPMLGGVRTILYPNPLHYAAVPAFAYDANATILFGSDTFLAGYARRADPYDFRSLRYIFAGAERVRPQTRATYADRFGLRIFEGYGATECAPVIAVNSPSHFRAGSVGRPLPLLQTRLEPVEGVAEGGRLHVRGPNIMRGYLRADRPGELQLPADGWYDTGDIATVDAEGFLTLHGRAKRFAKVGGEMVSLAAAEGWAAQVWPKGAHAVVARPDARKGERLVLVTTERGADLKTLQAWAREHGVAELSLPRELRTVDALPVLGAGKTDYPALEALLAAAEGDTDDAAADEVESEDAETSA